MADQETNLYEYDGMVMSSIFPASSLDRMKQTAFHDEDIIISTFPKCGTTWVLEIVSNIVNEAEKQEKKNLVERYLFIETHYPGKESHLDRWASTPVPHLIKSHMGPDYFQKTLPERQTKFIIVFRNPKDMLTSYFHFYKMNKIFNFNGTWDDYFTIFKENKLVHGDYFKVQLGWWKLRDNPRILILKYEDMLKSPEDAIRNISSHLGKTLSDEMVSEIAAKSSFKSMKSKPHSYYSTTSFMQNDISPFLRKGTVGDWKNFFTKEQTEYVDNLSKIQFESNGLFLEDV